MKKIGNLLIVLTAAIAVSFTSCNNPNDRGKTIWLMVLTSIETKEANNPSETCNFRYADGNSQVINPTFEFKHFPLLIEQQYNYRDISEEQLNYVKYGYSLGVLTLKMGYISGEIVDSVKCDDRGMAYSPFLKTIDDIKGIKYDPDGFRNQVNDTVLYHSNFKYTLAKIGNEETVFEYSDYDNNGIQQFGIPGSKYFWACGAFGRQSWKLLSQMKRYENGELVTYTYAYVFDSSTGMVTDENIQRNGELFMTNKYSYKLATINQQ